MLDNSSEIIEEITINQWFIYRLGLIDILSVEDAVLLNYIFEYSQVNVEISHKDLILSLPIIKLLNQQQLKERLIYFSNKGLIDMSEPIDSIGGGNRKEIFYVSATEKLLDLINVETKKGETEFYKVFW